jgi:SAM-dependent methyltransferase
MRNVDLRTVKSFGAEWTTFDQARVSAEDLDEMFEQYFSIFPWNELHPDAEGFDAGSGSGRWAIRVAPRVGTLHCIEASVQALAASQRMLSEQPTCVFHHASIADIPLPDQSMDFGYALGVLHHVPNTEDALAACVRKLKTGAPFLVYVYYAMENRPAWFRLLWRLSEAVRRRVCRLPHSMKVAVTTVIAVMIYWPLARAANVVERLGCPVDVLPLAYYRRRCLLTMRTDALDRFGTPLEQRFTADELLAMMRRAGLGQLVLSPHPPYWCALGRRVD